MKVKLHLHWACSKYQNKSVKVLLENGANIEAKDKYGWTPMQTTCINGYEKILKILLENVADVEAKNYEGLTTFFCAYRNNQKNIVKILKFFKNLKNQKPHIKKILFDIDLLGFIKTALVYISNKNLYKDNTKVQMLVKFCEELNNVDSYVDCNRLSTLINKYFLVRDILYEYSLNNFNKAVKDRLLLFNGLITKYQMSPDVVYKITNEFLDN